MHPFRNDVPVLLIFFTRVEVFKKVFEQVKIARPSKLFLYQDGPRENRLEDIENIKKCREIAEDIDWKCEVHKFYQPKNVGCDPSEYIAQKWAFSIVDRCIVLEDDDVPSQSFFPFCAELLEKYKDDERINMICGMNHLGISDNCPYDYLFSTSGAIWGWASWRRVTDTWEENYDFLNDDYALNLLNKLPDFSSYTGVIISNSKMHKSTGKAYYESILGASRIFNSRLNIVPKKNMISNVGISVDAVHTASSLELVPRGIRCVYNMKTHEMDFPLKHPKYVICDRNHVEGVFRILGRGHYWICKYRGIESRFLKIKRLSKKQLIKFMMWLTGNSPPKLPPSGID